MGTKPETNEFDARRFDDRRRQALVESAPVTETRTFDHDAALAPPRRAAKTPSYVVLAVDDDEVARLNTVMMLADLGHTALEANSGEQALEMLSREPAIRLMVAEMAMPQMSGLILCGVAQILYPRLRFVLATGDREASDCDEPALLRLPKPFLQFDLARTIEIAMDMAPWTPRKIGL